MRWFGPAVALMIGAAPLQAQAMRPFSTFRQLHGETRLNLRLEYAAGTLFVGAAERNQLYRLDLSYDQDRFVPVSDYDPAHGSALLGLKSSGNSGVRVSSRNQLQQMASLALSPRADLALDLKLGAVEAELELGGLRVSSLNLSTGASRTEVSFSRPNATRCRTARVTAGAAEVSVIGLGNSRCEEIEFEGGVGKVTLDFAGAWTSSAKVNITMAMGGLTLRLPRNVGVRVHMDRFLSSFEPSGLVRQDDSFVSRNYATATRQLDLEITAAVGDVNIEWVE